MQNTTTLLCFFFWSLTTLLLLNAQERSNQTTAPVQTIRGQVIDATTKRSIEGVIILIEGNGYRRNGRTSREGTYKLEKIPIGRYTIQARMIGYQPYYFSVVLTSGKEYVLTIELQESYITTKQVEVTSTNNPYAPLNENTVVSTHQFSMNDVERFAGTRGDPSRMAQNFAGVVGQNNLRNDIIIRGGSPTELLWRLDGLDIPNPNHFGTQGSTGGPVGAINTNVLANSDFLTGGFPAEYSDKMSGVFDLRTRNGNNERYEFLGQLSYNGAEAGAEGPLGFAKGSFIANYRYSFLDVLTNLGMDLGIVGVPRYQDGFAKVHLIPDGNNTIDITSMFGANTIFMDRSSREDVLTGDWNLKSSNNFSSVGVRWQHLISDNAVGVLLLGHVRSAYTTAIDSITCSPQSIHTIVDIDRWFDQQSFEGYTNAKYTLTVIPYQNHILRFGVEGRYRFYELLEKRYTDGWGIYTTWDINATGNTVQYLGYADWNWKISPLLTTNIGIHSQYLTLSNRATIEPRIGIKYEIASGQFISAAYSVHRQSLPLLLYYSSPRSSTLDFMESRHTIVGYSTEVAKDILLKVESYYKDITRVPVSGDIQDSWSFLNSGTNFGSVGGKVNIASTGTGRCYGAELTVLRHFNDGYYFTTTASYIRQLFTASDGIERYGGFDNRVVFNLLAGYEWKVSESLTIECSGRYSFAGGTPYTPIDERTSKLRNQTFFEESQSFSQRKPSFQRVDVKVDFRTNYAGVSIIGYFSVENLFNTKNVLEYQWSVARQRVDTVYQLGFFPLGGVRVEF